MYVRVTYPKIQCFDSNGDPAVGYEIHTFKAGLTTALTTYNNRDLAVGHANTNPVILNARGEADIYVGEVAKLIFTIPSGDTADPIWSIDYIAEQQSNFVTGTGITATTNNYTVTTIPAVSALTNNFMLIMTPDESNVSTLTSNVFTGTGINDCTESGAYVGSNTGAVFTLQIDSLGTSDTFKWKKDAGAWTTGVVITGAEQIISEGLSVTFAVITGHTLNDLWAITVQTPARVNLDTLGNLIVYKNKGGSIVALDGDDMKVGYPAQLILNAALNAWLLINPATPTFSTPTITANRYRKNLTTTYAMIAGDQGYELSCVGTFTITLLTCPEFSGKFFYVKNAGTGIITLDAGAYNIYGNGTSTHLIDQGGSFQLQTNGVNWHILTSIGFPQLIDRKDVAAQTNTFTGLIPGIKYRLNYELALANAGNDVRIRFNADTNNYHGVTVVAAPGVGVSVLATSTDYIISVSAAGAVNTKGMVEFETFYGNNKKVDISGHSHCSAVMNITTGDYTGAADLTSVSVYTSDTSLTGRIWLWQVG